MVLLQDIIDRIAAYSPDADFALLSRAHDFAERVHSGQVRLSGDPYMTHPLEVALILTKLKMDVPTIVTGLLHDTIEDTSTTHEVLVEEFGEEIASMVDGVTKIGKITFRTSAERQAENFRKMLLAMARDIRVILVKLADRLHNMRTLSYHPEGRQKKIAEETRDIYIPLANRLGISWIKSELEDLSFRYLETETFYDLVAKVAKKKKEREEYIEEVKKTICDKLDEQGIHGEVSGRSKHLYSIYLKMKRQGIDFDEVYDLIAFRVLVTSVRECYSMLGVIHSSWKPVPGRFKDYIAMPKANMYQSLHTTVIGPYGERMEVQIRTFEMHQIAEEGIAAHWKYKEGKGSSGVVARHDKQFRWLRQMLEWQQELKDSREFMASVKVDLFPEEVYVFTPGGDVKELPKGATAIDFAYSVHTDVGHRCVSAKVNGKLVPLKTQLINGDVVEVTTAAKHNPSKDWLKFVRTSKAKNKIRQWVKAEQREKSLNLGRELLEKEFRKHGYSLKRALGLPEFTHAVEELGFKTGDDLIAGIGYGKVPLGQVVGRVINIDKAKAEPAKLSKISKVVDKVKRKSSSAIQIQGVEDILVRYAKCCNPLPGDHVIGFITRGRGVTVHTADCPHAMEGDPERRIDVEWDKKRKATRSAKVQVYCADEKGMLSGITGAISNSEANILSANVHSTRGERGVNTFEIDVQDLDHLNRVIKAILNVKGVYKVERMRN